MKKRERNQVISDETDATVREAQRQAEIERDNAIEAAKAAADEAAQEPTALAAKLTFRERFKRLWNGDA